MPRGEGVSVPRDKVNKNPPKNKTVNERKITPKEEEFAVCVASGMTQADAYNQVYAKSGASPSARNAGCQIAGRPVVAARIAELRNEHARTVVAAKRAVPEYGLVEAMDELNEAMAVAKERGNPTAMAKVVEVRMKLYGLGVSDAKNPKDKEDIPPEQLESMLDTLRRLKESHVTH